MLLWSYSNFQEDAVSQSEKTRPNILFIQVDQLAPQALSAYGHPLVKTPNLDKLEDRSVVFENAYCN